MVEDQVRTIKLALESRIGARVPSDHPLMHWVVLHDAGTHNKFAVNKTGKSPYGEGHGQRSPERRVEFGERMQDFSLVLEHIGIPAFKPLSETLAILSFGPWMKV